eukprot:m.135460 g.135460  ORF g.135460 m.135460 type:complete len:392 (+) comp15994_c0_seq2:20-1195(+)
MCFFFELSVLAIASFVTYKAYDAGEFGLLSYHDGEHCQQFGDIIGAEDVRLWSSSLGEAYVISSDDRSWLGLTVPSSRSLSERLQAAPNTGKLYYVLHEEVAALQSSNSSDQPTFNAIELVGIEDAHFHPLGIDLYSSMVDDRRKTSLFVATYTPQGNAVMVFDLHMMPSGKAIATLQSKVSSPHITNPNAVAALDHRAFFVSAWLTAEPGTLASTLEVLQKQPVSAIVHCASPGVGIKFACKPAASNLRMVNGVTYDAYAQKLYYVESLNKTVTETRWNGKTLQHVRTTETDTACDNLAVHPTKRGVLTACHPKMLTFTLHAQHVFDHAPTQVLFIPSVTASQLTMEEYLMDDGSLLPAASGAFMHPSGLMLVGSVHGKGLLACNMQKHL